MSTSDDMKACSFPAIDTLCHLSTVLEFMADPRRIAAPGTPSTSATSMSIPESSITAPTPQNTPAQHAPISSGLSRPTVPDIAEGDEEESEVESIHAPAAMFNLVQDKLSTLIGRSSGYIESLPPSVKTSVRALKGVQVKQDAIWNQYKWEALELERKYLALSVPLYERRRAIIEGRSADLTDFDADLKAGNEVEEKEHDEDENEDQEEKLKESTEDKNAPPEAIPSFWLTTLQNHPGIAELITPGDEDALTHLLDISVSYLPVRDPNDPLKAFNVELPKEVLDKPGFSLILKFNTEMNPYFSDPILTKTYVYKETVGETGEFVYDRAIGCTIHWKSDDKDLTREWEVKRQRNKNTNRTRLVRKAKPTDSFFNFFNPPVLPDDDVEIIPRAVDYFTGKALEYEMVDSDSEEEDEDNEVFDSDEASDADSDVPPASGRRHGRGGAPRVGRTAANQNVNPEECKQQ
ncbi:NAP-domain-containing protein [Fistulina hepatica ATCC 64428]|uniref:NAP-domain-containing protein n=1 Tax=Fistulina hepatica ATCC 64428 TaxID=1128425 RepID=A0A0D7ANK7_9AGAR|nr:NAP-domain-containing protein [Fistulina hepatica ATCC 64428]